MKTELPLTYEKIMFKSISIYTNYNTKELEGGEWQKQRFLIPD